MSDRKEDSTTSAHNEKTVSQQQDEAYEQMEKDIANPSRPAHTPDRAAAPGEEDAARASRSRDGKKSTDGKPAGQQQRLGTHPPLALSAALAQAADTVQATISQAQQNINMANAMQHAVAPPALMFHQQQSFHPPPGGHQNQYPMQGNADYSQIAAPYQPAGLGTPFGFGGNPLSGFPPQPMGPCTSTSVHTAPLQWRGGDGDGNIESNTSTAEANEMWRQMDNHPHLLDPEVKPAHSDGCPCIQGAEMFKSQTLVPGLVFLGEKGAGRWCEAREAVTLLVTNSTSEFKYTLEDVRNSIASDIDRLNDYDDACILEDLPAAMGPNGPYRVTMAAAAALSLIEAEGVCIFHYDPAKGIDDELDFDVELLLPSGRKYNVARPDRPPRQPKKHDTSCRIRFQMIVPVALSARSAEERGKAMTRLRDHLRRHFMSHNAHNVGFHKHRDERSGRLSQGLTGFVNHPATVSRADFITTTFQDLKYIDAGMGELVKLTLDHDDIVKASIMKCCFRAVCLKQRGQKCDAWVQMMRRCGLFNQDLAGPNPSARGKRKVEVTSQQEEFRVSQMSAIKARRIEPECRAHTRGRCVNGTACKAPHLTDPATILCNSMVTPADKGVSSFNRSYGFCALHLKSLACPYKDCVHSLVTDELQTENAHGSQEEGMET